MRSFIIFTAVMFGIFRASLAQGYVDASQRTSVGVSANAWDRRTSGNGCSPDGCVPENTRDNSLVGNSRWSCSEELNNEVCEICYTFGVAQDIEITRIALWQGNTRTRSISITYHSRLGSSYTTTETFHSSGQTSYFEDIVAFKDETSEVCMRSIGLGSSEWLSILEVRFMVE